MGNPIYLSLIVENNDPNHKVIEEIRSRYPDAQEALVDDGESDQADAWYDYHTDLIEYSLLYPNLLLILHTEGSFLSESTRNFYQSGKHYQQAAKIVYDNFNPEMLTN